MHWRRKWQSIRVFLFGESQGWRSLVGCHLWGLIESDTTEVMLAADIYMLSPIASVETTICLGSHKKTGICQIKNVTKIFNYHLTDTK